MPSDELPRDAAGIRAYVKRQKRMLGGRPPAEKAALVERALEACRRRPTLDWSEALALLDRDDLAPHAEAALGWAHEENVRRGARPLVDGDTFDIDPARVSPRDVAEALAASWGREALDVARRHGFGVLDVASAWRGLDAARRERAVAAAAARGWALGDVVAAFRDLPDRAEAVLAEAERRGLRARVVAQARRECGGLADEVLDLHAAHGWDVASVHYALTSYPELREKAFAIARATGEPPGEVMNVLKHERKRARERWPDLA